MSRFFAVAALIAGNGVEAGNILTNCGAPGDHLSRVVVTSPSADTEPFTIAVSGELDEDITEGFLDFDGHVEALGVIDKAIKGTSHFYFTPGVKKGAFYLKVGPLKMPWLPGTNKLTGTLKISDVNKQQVMCLGLDVPLMDTSAPVEPVKTDPVTLCSAASDHMQCDLTTKTCVLDELVQTLSVNVDMKVHVGWFPVPVSLAVPVVYHPGFVKGTYNITATNVSMVETPITVGSGAELTGTIKIKDGKGEEVICLSVDTPLGTKTGTGLAASGPWDEIKTLICQALKSGMATHEVEDLVCNKLKYKFEVTACDKVVDLLVSKIESGALDCSSTEVIV